MRVLHLLPYLERGGTEKAVYTLALSLPTWQTKVLAPPGKGAEPFKKEELLLPYQGSLKKSFRAALKDFQPDLIHLHAGIHYFPMLKKVGLPLIFTGHGYPTNFDYKLASFSGNRWAQKVICVSEAEQRRFLRAGLRPEKATVIYNGIFLPKPNQKRAQELKTSLGLDGRPVVLLAGRLVADKGLFDLLAAYIALEPRPQLVIAGEGPLAPELERERERLGLWGDLFLPGFVDNIADLISLASFVVLPSHREAQPLFLLEALALGKPIVGTDVGGIGEVVGECGILVPAKDPHSLALALERALTAPLAEFGRRGQKRWEQLFSAESMGAATEAVYQAAVK